MCDCKACPHFSDLDLWRRKADIGLSGMLDGLSPTLEQ